MHRLLLRELGLLPLSRWVKLASARPSGAPADAASRPRVQPDLSASNLAEVQQRVRACELCALAQSRTQTVFARGKPLPGSVMVVGEAPGAEEDRQGQPFVGKAGQLLDNLLKAIELPAKRNVYITNIVKCRPPGNRNPQAEEIRSCLPYLLRQIELINPVLIIAAGKVSSNALLDTDMPMHAMRRKVHDFHGRPLVAVYHPAYLLRSPLEKRRAWEDLLLVRRTLAATG